ncbi:hemicentin-1-like [Hyposmocoma kahamanoa]|uniref:hemicentin-1-like n=1 Tax=Hyposmocoma kahamanoa TaxID=1477025 RepID=UPI000E6D73C4|nr:hemicentin-1-like [Hyposmocoma kahamanoa]
MPKEIAKFLNLPDPDLYTGHSFRRTSATLLADSGADLLTLKRHGGWRSSTVAESYVEDSVRNKSNICTQITHAINLEPQVKKMCPEPQPSTSRDTSYLLPRLSISESLNEPPPLSSIFVHNEPVSPTFTQEDNNEIPEKINISEFKKSPVYENVENDKSSLVFVFDTTGSMYNDLEQLRNGAGMILETALEDSDVIEDFVFVPFRDPAVGPAIVTKDKEVFKTALDDVRVYGGGDCPEKSLTGIHLALNVSRSRSFVYVFTDATAADHGLVGNVLDSIQRKQSQVVFVLTGHCNDLHRPSYKVYQQIAAASAGQVFNLNKTSVHNVLDFVRSSIKGRTVNLGSVINVAGYNHTQGIPVDNTLGEVTVSVSGAQPSIKVVNPSGEELTGPPKLITTLDLSEIMVVKVLQPEPGNWTITTGSAEDYSVKVVGLSNLTFTHGFSVEQPRSVSETTYRPLQGTYNHMVISLTQIDQPVHIDYAEILSLNGRTLFEVPLRVFDEPNKIYIADPFVPPNDFFYVAINGRDEFNQELRRIGATAIQPKTPDVPYLTAQPKIEARAHERIVLRCHIESLVPVTAMWTKDMAKIQPQISSLQTTSIEYVIDDMSEEDVGTYRCVAKNVAGISKAVIDVSLLVDSPQVIITPENKTFQLGERVTITCLVITEALLWKYQLDFKGARQQYAIDINLEPNVEGLYMYNKTIQNVTDNDDGVYSCIARNRGGETIQSTYITVQFQPQVQILGPHTLTKHNHANLQLVCHVDNADKALWLAPNGSSVREVDVKGSSNDMLDLYDVELDGVWSCVAVRGKYRVKDSVELIILIKPEVSIEGPKNITIVNGTAVNITCIITAKPLPRIIWHKETERFLNHEVTVLKPNVYKSVLTLNSTKEPVNATYFCFGENSEGINQDSVIVNVKRKMQVVECFSDISVQLHSQLSLACRFDAHPSPIITWYHNGTEIRDNQNIYLTDNRTLLNILRVDFDNLGIYVCEANNGYERMEIKGLISVHGLEVPVISKESAEIVAQKGKPVEMPCRITKGNPKPKITWQYKREDLEFSTLSQEVRIENSTENAKIVIMNAKVNHKGIYRCVAENVIGRDVFEFELIVQYPPELSLQTSHDDSPVEIKAGNKAQFSCKAEGNPPPVVVWMKDKQPIGYSENVYLTKNSELVIEKTTQDDSGLFTCNVTSSIGFVQKNFTLVVYEPPSITPSDIGPELETLEGQLVELPCAVKGQPTPDIVWLQNGEIISEGRKFIDNFGLRFVANLTDFGEYTCTARNKYGNATYTFIVLIWVPPSIHSPLKTSQSVISGNNITLQCDAIGFPVPTILWEFRDQLIMENTTELSFNEYGNIYISNSSSKYEGMYSCIAENIAGFVKKSIYLNVYEPPTILQDNYPGPFIATSRDKVIVISCRVNGKPEPFVSWTKDNRYLDKDSQYNIDVDGTLTIKAPSEDLNGLYTCIAKNAVGMANKTVSVQIYSVPARMQADETISTETVLEGTNVDIECPIRASHADKVKWYKDAKLISTSPLQIQNITRHDASMYACVVSNMVASMHSLVHLNVEWPPQFIDNLTDNIEVVKGNDNYFNCDVDAKPAAKAKWYFNARPLVGQDKKILKLIDIQLRHTGVYKCVVGNLHGTVARQFTLDVLVPPFISDFDVLDVQLLEGTNATLECDAKGLPKPNIQWSYNNTNWHLQNSSLTIYNASVDSEGTFRCDAMNKAGATYIVYRVFIVAPATVEDVVVYRQGENGGETVQSVLEVELDTRVRLSCTSSGHPTPTIQWIHNGIKLSENSPKITYADLVLDNVHVKQGGMYSCIVSNEGGMDEIDVKVEVLEPPKIFHALFQPASNGPTKLELISDQSFSLHCHPYGNPLPAVYWFRNGQPLTLFDDSMIRQDYGEVLTVDRARFDQSGNYTCVAKNKVGEASLIYLVDVLVPPPTPKESSKVIATRTGKLLTLSCPVEGSPLPEVMWIKHPYTEINGDTPKVTLADNNYTLITVLFLKLA